MKFLLNKLNSFETNTIQNSFFSSKLFLLILLFSLISKMQMAQATCYPYFSTLFPTIALCDAPLNMSSYVSPSPGACTFSGGAFITSSTYFSPSVSGAGLFTIEYNPAGGCGTPYVTQTIRVVNTDYIDILANGTSLSKVTLNATLTCSLTVAHYQLYSGFQWYKNGFAISGATNYYYVTDDMGTYSVKALGQCGNYAIDEIDVVCDCDYDVESGNFRDGRSTPYHFSATETLPGSGGKSNNIIDYVFAGTIIIDEDVEIDIDAANVKMMPCTKIIIMKGSTGVPGGLLRISTNSTLTGCDKWQGIIINGDPVLTYTAIEHGRLETYDAVEISDAYIAIYSDNGGRLKADRISFENNENDITLRDYATDYSIDITLCNFKGKWMNNDISSLCTMYEYVTPANTTQKKMIYLSGVQYINIDGCTFLGNDFLDGNNFQTNAIEMNELENVNVSNVDFDSYFSSALWGNEVVNTMINYDPDYSSHANYLFNHYYLDGTFDKAFYFTESDNIALGYFTGTSINENRFLGTMNYATYITNSTDVIQYGNIFNSTTYASPSSASGSITNGVYYENINPLRFEQNRIIDIANGAHFVDCVVSDIVGNRLQDCSNYAMQMYGEPSGNNNQINENKFVDCNYALLISPDGTPLSSGNSSASTMNLSIECNLFEGNNFGIIGCGDIIDQYNGGYTNGNKFDGNIEYDLLWEDNGGGFLFGQDISSDPTRANLYTSNTMVVNVNGYSSPQDFTVLGTTVADCFNYLKRAPIQAIIPGIEDNFTIINNPVSEILLINVEEFKTENILCYDALGKVHSLALISQSGNSFKFNTLDLAAGIYYFTINNKSHKFIKL